MQVIAHLFATLNEYRPMMLGIQVETHQQGHRSGALFEKGSQYRPLQFVGAQVLTMYYGSKHRQHQ